MVRETRHLWVGNLPENIREDRILEHFKRYGKVQSVKILPRNDDDPSSGVSATVAFIDIKSAAKAHNGEHKIEERTLKTDYYEPPASSTASSAIYIHERDDSLARSGAPTYTGTRPSRYPHGRPMGYHDDDGYQSRGRPRDRYNRVNAATAAYPDGLERVPEDRNYERPGHYYDRVVERETYLRRPMGYHDDDGYQSRGRPRDRYNRVNAATAAYPDGLERNQSHFRTHGTRQHFDLQRYPCADQYAEEREGVASAGRLVRRPNSTTSGVSSTVSSPPQQRTTGHHKKQKRKSPSRSHSGSRSNSPSRSRSSSRSTGISRSSSSSSKLRSSSSDSSSRSRSPSKSRSPAASYGSQGSRKGGRSDRPASTIAAPPTSGSFLPSTVATPATTSVTASSQGSSQSQSGCSASSDNCNDKEDKRPRAICVRNLPVRSTDTSLKDGLFHEYKKHGKVTMVKVIGQGTDRYAVVCFKKPDDVEKALEVSRDKLFFGCKIEVTAHEGLDGEDNDFRPLEAELDEYHPKATRTLFIGNLEKDIMTSELRKHFEAFGEIIEIDIKKQATASSYAFIQYSDIASVVKAMRKLDGENLGANRIKLGFGKSMPTNCVWMDGIVDTITEKALVWHFHRFGPVGHIAIDREKGHALVFYDSLDSAQIAVSEMRGRILGGKRLQVDFASRECQIAFFEKMEMTGQLMPGERPWERRERRADFEVLREERDTRAGFDSYGRNYNRYDGQQRAARGTFRGIQRTGFNNRGRGQGFTGRNFEEEFSQGSGASIEDSYEQELREYGYCQRERRDFGSDEHSVRGKSFSPVRRKDIGSISPPQREKHGDDRSSSPHSRSSIHGGDKHDYHHLRDRFSSREDGIEDGSGYEDKPDRTKSLEISEKLGKKKGKHRSSVSDQESHHSQSPPHSRHQSRSRSPPVKDKRPLKDRERLHGRARSPGSRSSSHVGSPTRDISMDFEMFADKEGTSDAKESVRRKSSLSKQEAKDAVLPVLCPKPEPLQDVCEKSRVRGNLEALKRRLQDCDLSECSPSIELSSPTERKRRLLEVSDHVTSKDVLAQLRTESEHLVRRNSVIPTLLSVKSEVVSSESAANDDGKSDTESGELLEEAHVEKPRAESANDLKTLEKEHLQLLQLLEQLGEGATSSDTEGSGELDEPSKKKAKSLRLLQHNVVKGLHASLPGKNECQDSAVFTSKVGEMEDGVDVCVMPKGMDSLLSSRKPMDPRKSLDQVNASSVASHHRLKRFISEKDILRLNNERTDTELLGSSPSSIGIPHRTKSSFGSIQRVSLLDGDSASCVDEGGADNSVKDDHSAEEVSSSGESVTHRKLSRSNLSSLELSRQSSLSLRVSGSSSSENKKEKEMCPLSLPLPEFAASLRSPKVVLNPLLSPKANSLSPRGGHSPSACLTSKSPYHSLSEAGKLEKIASHCVENKATTTVCTVSQASDSKSSPALPLTISSPLMSPKSPKKSNEVESSSDSECSALSSPNCPSIEERIRALDEKFNAWSGSTRCISTSLSSESTPPTPTIDYQKYNIKKRPRFLPEFRTEPSDIVKSLLAKSSIFDQDSKRLEHINEKYEPKEVNIDLSPKAKPFFRTKAAAKEFATPIPSLTSLNHTSGANRFSMFYSTSTASVTTPPSLTSSQTSTPAVPSPVPSHLTSVSLSNQSSTHYLSSHSSSILTSSSPSIITSTSKMATDLNALNQQKPATTQPAFNTSSTLRKTVDLNSKTVPPCIRKEPSATNVACPSSVSSVKTGSISASSSSLQHQCGSNGTGGGGAGSGSGGGGVTVSSTMAKKESIPVVKDTSALSSSSVCVKKESNKDSVSRKDSVSSSSVKDIPQKKECSSTSSSSSSVSKNASSKRETVPKDLHKDSLAIKDVKRESAHAVGNKEQFMAKKDSVAATFGKEKQPVSCVATLSKDNKHDVMQATGAKEQFVSKKEASNLNSAIKDVPKSECASDIVGPSTKRRVPSIDSESDSGKSSDVRIESRDNQWQTVEVKSENKTSMDSEHKKSKPNQSNNSRDVEKGEEKSSSPQPHTPKKSEKKDKNSRSSDKSSKSNISRSDSKVNLDRRDDQDSRGSEGKASSESKEKSRSECPKSKDDKKLKSKDNKGSGKNDWRNRSKSTESNRSSEKLDKKSTHSNNKSKREHATEKIEKQSERKQPSNETTKHDSGSSKPRRRRSEAKLSFSEEEPVYFSMYDKVKARSSQNQSLKEAKDLESVRQKFSQLKRSRAKREEKAKSHEMETDDDSDSASHMSEDKDAPSKIRTTPKSKQSKKRKLVIESSSDNEESCPPTTIADFQSKEERGGDVSSDAGFDSDAASHPGPLSLQLMSPTYNTSKARSKCKELSDDSPSSDDLSQLISSVNKKSKSSPGATEPDIKPAKCLKSDNESSDNEQVIRMPKKKKDGGKKKLKKEKYIERLLESDASDVEIFRKTEDHKSKKNVIKEEKHTPETNYNEIYHTSTKERKLSGSSNSKSATSTKNDTENNEHEAKPKTPSKKKKKSKKSKAKEKKPSGEKTESKSDIPKVVETKEPSPKLAASPPKEVSTPALPSLPILNMFSDNEFNKSDFSDIEIETEKPILAEAEQDPLQWMCTDNKQDSESENKLLDNIKSEPPEIVQNATTEQEKMDPLPSTNLQPMLEKIDSGSSHNSATSQSGECSAELESSRIEVAESLVTAENVIVDTPVKKHHQSHKKSSNDETKKESRSKSRGDEEHSKEEKHKKKNKKQSKEKKRKSKDDHKMDDLPPSLQEILEPTFHDKMPPLDEESRMSEDIRLDEDIAEQARRLEAELLAATEETSTFGDTEGPCRREEKVQERRFEEEAAKETRRLEEELMSTAREPWHMKETKPFDDDDALDQAAPPLDDNSEKEQKMTQEAVETLTLKENTLFCNLDGSSSVGISVADHDPTQDFLVDQDESDQFKLDEKDVGSYEVDNQRKIEDDLAVSALLQEMNCEESAPLLTKETDYLGPLLEPSAEEAISYLNNYLVEGPINESPNHISDMPQEEQTEEKMPPPLLEIPDPIIAPEAEAPHHLVPSEELKEVPEAMPECPQVQLTNHLPEETLLPGSTPETDDEPPLVSCERLMQPAELSQPLSPGNPPVLEMEMSVIKNETSRKHRKKRKKEKTMKPDVKELDKLKSFNTMKFFPEVVSLSELETYSDSNKEFHNLKSPSKKADCSEALSYSEPLQIPDVKVEHSDDNNMMKINEIPEIKDLVIDQNPPSEKELEKLEDVLQFKDIMNIHQESAVPGTPEKIEAAAVAEETQEKESPAEDTSGYLPDSIKFSVIKSTAEEHPENMESEALLENEEPPLKMDKEEEEPKEDEPTTSELPLPHASKISEEEVCNNFPVSIPEMFPENELDSEPPAIPEFLSESKLSDNLPPVQLESPFPLERIAEPPDMSESHRLLESDCSGLLSDSLCSEERKDNGSDHTEDSDKTEIVDDSEYQPGVGDLAEDGDKEGVLSFEDDAREAELDTEREIISSEAVVPEEEEEEEEESVVNTAEQPLQEMATLPSEPKVPIVPSEAEGEDEAAPLIEHDDRKKHHRSRRGRRAKTRKFSEPSATMPKYECDADVLPTMTQLRSSKRGRTSVVEKTKRNLRSQMLDISIPLEPVDLAAHIECVQASETNEGNTTAIDTTESSLQASEETIAKNTANGSPTMDEDTSKEVCEETDNKTEDSHQISEQQYESTEIKPEELRKRKGRKKKGSGESHCGIDKVDIKRDEGDTKEVHRQRLLLPLSSSERCLDQKATRGNSSLYDVFEFREEDEDLAFNREMPSAVRNLDPPRSSGHIHDHRHHESKHSESLHEREKRHDDSKHKSSHHDDRDISGKEYVTELSQHGKISITIRLHQKDSHDGSFSSTAEVVKTSEAVSAEEPKIDSTRSEKTSKADNSSSDASGTNTVKPTRKSARLMSQAPKTTVDEVIEDVVKGNFKGLDSEGAAESVPVRPTRRTRANRRSEEALARQQEDSVIEPAFASTDTNQKTKYDALPSSDKSKDQFLEKAGSLSSPPAAVSEVNNPGDGELKSESRMSLRSFRFTRSAARNEASKESAGCSSSSTLPEQVPEKNDTSGLAQNSVPTRKDHESLKSPPPTSSEESNAQQQHAECGQSRTTLPVLKVELPRMSVSVLAQVHSITMGESVKTKETKGNVNQKQSENDDEGDSRSSPTALIDPVTGFLTPVTKKDPPADKQPPSVSSDQAKETQENVQAAAPTPPPSLPQVSIPSVSEPCSSPPVTSITETMTTSNSTPSTYVPPRTSTEHISHTSLLSPSSQLVVQSPTNPPSTSSETVVSSAPEHCLSTISSSSSVSSTSVVVPPQSSTPQSIVQNEPSQTSVATSTSEPSKLPSCIQSASSSVVHSTLALHSAATTKAGASVCLTTTSTTPTTSITTSHVSLPSAIPQAHSPVGQPQVSLCHPMPAWPQTPPTSSAQLAAFHPYVPPAVRGIPGSSSGLKLSKPYATASIHSPSPVIQQSLAKTVAPTVVVSSAQGVNITPAEINPKRLSAPHLSASVTLPSVKSEVVGPECLTSTAQSVSRSPNIMTSCKVESTQVTSSSTPLPLIPPAHSRTESSSPRIATSQGNLGHSAGTSPATASRHLSTVITTQTGVLSHANAATTMAPSHGIGKHEISQVSQSGSGGSSKQSHAHSSKHSPNFMHQSPFPTGAFEAAVHSASRGLTPPTSTNSGVIAELLQNPHLLQHKEYLAAAAQHTASSSSQFTERMPSQMVRPSLTSALHADMATRLGNPTPPHTPTPPVTSATHSLQPPELHATHLAGIHLRHPAQPTLIVPPHHLGIHPNELTAYVHQQMMYAAAHPHYAALHPELRAQQEAQARAAAMGIPPRFAYPHIPPTASSTGFRQPLEPVVQHSVSSDSKLETKAHIENSKSAVDQRLLEERSKSSKIKQEVEKEAKSSQSELRMPEETESKRLQGVVDSRHASNRHVSSPLGSIRPPGLAYPTPIRQLRPHISLSPHERLTDSPAIAHPYAQGAQLRTAASQVPPRPEELKQEPMQRPQQVKSESTERDVKPPAAHKQPPTTMAFHTIDTVGLSHPLLGVPPVGSPAPGYLEGRPIHQSALVLKKEAAPSPVLVPPLHQAEPHEVHKKVSHGRLLQQQKEPALSPGLSAAHSPSPISNLVVSRASQQPLPTLGQPTAETNIRRANIHPIPQTGSEAPVHPPPPAHAMSQPGAPQGHPQTPPHASQVPPQGDSLLLQRYPVMWQGLLALKNDQAAVQMHFVSGNPRIARASLPPVTDGGTPPVRIAQRMRLEQTQLEGVARKMQMVDEHCILLALPCGRDHMDVLQQSNNLRNGFINYLQSKQAAGIVNAAAPGSQQAAYVIHIFPSCDFSNENMARIAPDLLHSVSDIAHLLIIIATV